MQCNYYSSMFQWKKISRFQQIDLFLRLQICGIQCRHIVYNVYYKIIEYVLLHYKVSYSYSLGHNGQATKFSISVRCDINLNLFEWIDYVYLENHLNYNLIKFQILYWTKDNLSINSIVRFGAPAKMAKYFEFTNNHSDVFVVGNSQLAGFTGVNKDKDCSMNISMCRGAKIEDCLEECDRSYHNSPHQNAPQKIKSSSPHEKVYLLM